MELDHIIGLTAGLLTSGSTLPQILKTYRFKDVQDISIKMFSILFIGVSLWVVYGFIKSDMPIIITNSLAVLFNGIMLLFKLRYKK